MFDWPLGEAFLLLRQRPLNLSCFEVGSEDVSGAQLDPDQLRKDTVIK